jgi:hypothetical protein
LLSSLKLALISAIPIEILNFWVVGYPANPSSASAVSRHPAIALQWYLFHLAGIIASDRFLFLREHPRLDSLVLFIMGYAGTAVFLALVVWLVHLALLALHKLSSPLGHAH